MRINLKNKKSQVALFIILGLLILIGAIFLIYIRSTSVTPEKSLSIIQEQLPNDFKPVQTLVTQCITDLSKEAIIKIGLNGGYIDPTITQYSSSSFNFEKQNPTESDGITVSDEHHVPYWYHMPSPSNCEFSDCYTELDYPLAIFMEEQISKYVDFNLNNCLNDFEAIKEMEITVTQITEPETTTIIAKNDIVVQTNYKLSLKKGNSKSETNYYNVIHNLEMTEIYMLAINILRSEANHRTFEKILFNTMNYYMGADQNLLPPLYSTLGEASYIMWMKHDVKNKIEELIYAYLPLVRIENTRNAELFTSEQVIENNILNFLYLKNDLAFNNYEVYFHYNQWPIYLDIKPHIEDGSIIRAQKTVFSSSIDMMPDKIISTFESRYDIAYPILVEVRDPDAFDGQGYSLFFALEANIKENQDIALYRKYGTPEWPTDAELSLTGVDVEKVKTYDEDGNEMELVTPPKPPGEMFFCDEAQRVAQEVKFIVKESHPINIPVEEAMIYYVCGPFATCLLGLTAEDGTLTTKLPMCNGGAVKVALKGYDTKYVPFDSEVGFGSKTQLIEIYKPMRKLVQFQILPIPELETFDADEITNKIEIKEIIDEISFVESSENLALGPDDDFNMGLMLMFIKEKENAYDSEYIFTTYLNLSKNSPETVVELVPGDYRAEINYFNYSVHEVLGDSICTSEWAGTCWDSKWVDGVNISTTVPGMVSMNYENNYMFHVKYDDLVDEEKDTLIFYIPKGQLPEKITGMEIMNKITEASDKYRLFIEPKWMDSNDVEWIIPPEHWALEEAYGTS
ncbi:hypothetical protein HOC35_01020 [Candidatus Woesearchaeota archaeon]|nr:hypothetical protein [Candidatus Woesearchaeota archaeon]